MHTTQEILQDKINKILVIRTESNAIRSKPVGPPEQPEAPISIDELDIVSRACPFELPPSYIDFLKMHNGWKDFDGMLNLISSYDRSAGSYKKHLEVFKTGKYGKRIKDFDSLFPIAIHKEGFSIIYIDPKTAISQGERKLIHVDYIGGKILAYDNMMQLFELKYNLLRKALEALKDSRAGKI